MIAPAMMVCAWVGVSLFSFLVVRAEVLQGVGLALPVTDVVGQRL
jgi:hypothetical protein